MIEINGPESGTTKTAFVGKLQFYIEGLLVIVSDPLVIPRNFLDACSASDDLGLEVHCSNDPVDLTCTEQAPILRTATGFTGADELAAVIVAILVSNCIATPVVGNAHQNLC